MTDPVSPSPVVRPRWASTPVTEGLSVWAVTIGLLAVAQLLGSGLGPWGASIAGAGAVALFLWMPGHVAQRLGRPDDTDDYGLDRSRLVSDVVFALVVMLMVFPPFVLAFRWGLELWDGGVLPAWTRVVTPYRGRAHFVWRLPDGLVDKVAGHAAIAAAEEFFYRGYLQRRLAAGWPGRTQVLGVPFGRAAWVQTALFALGHLLHPALFRLATFFPGLLFTWMAQRSGRVLPGAIVHWASNLLIATLEASAFGSR